MKKSNYSRSSSVPDQSRRAFLTGIGAVTALGLAPALAKASREPVIIIGAGLAGLYAAMELESRGFPVTVIEARQRVGGRIRTLDKVPGHPEGGGNTIGPNYGRVIRTARMLGVPLRSPGRAESMGLVVDGQRVAREQWPESPLNKLPEPLRTLTPDRLGFSLLRDNPLKASWAWRSPSLAGIDQSAADFYRGKGLDDTAIGWIDANNSYGNQLQETSLLSLYRVGANIGRAISMRQPTLEAAAGNQRIPEAMASALAGELVLGEQVTGISSSGGDTRVDCLSGRSFHAAAVICALPLTALRKIQFSPGLSPEQAKAFSAINYHKVTQAHLVTDEPYWETAGEPGGWWTNGSLGRVFTRRSEEGHYNITCWINGDSCDQFDRLPEADARQLLLDQFHRLVPASRGHVELRQMVAWMREPLNEGTWAIWKPGQIEAYSDVLLQPHDRIHFAGEHTGFSNSGMEAAMESGERAAMEVMRALA